MNLMTIKETAVYCKVSVSYIRKHIKLNNIPIIAMGTKICIDKDELDALLVSQRGFPPLDFSKAITPKYQISN